MKLILFETHNLGTVSSLFMKVGEGESGREGEGEEKGNGGISKGLSSKFSSLRSVSILLSTEFNKYLLF